MLGAPPHRRALWLIYLLYTYYVMYRLHYVRVCMFVGKIFKIFLAHVGILFYLCTHKQETLTLKNFIA